MEYEPPSERAYYFIGGYWIPLSTVRDKLCIALDHEFDPPEYARDYCGVGEDEEGFILAAHLNNYLAKQRKDLHPCLTFATPRPPDTPWYLVILTHSERDKPESGGNIEENEHDLKVKAFLLTEGKLDPEDIAWRCMWKNHNTLADERLIPTVSSDRAMFCKKVASTEEFIARFITRGR
ncbi:hypothetical protein QCA50_020382 [Cerrena zonata]|uniref:Uncharacterized protein n=1 Tax=Cerrena zonata TaxID=2478898 RepID=A0AAW0FD98_9APHY